MAQAAPPTSNLNPTPTNVSPVGVQLGLSGLKRSYGYVYEELLPVLQGRKAISVYSEMSENDPVIGATLFAIDMFMRKVPWRVEAASTSAQDQKNAELLASIKNDMRQSWPDFISEVNSMLPFGWSWFEILYKRRDNTLVDAMGNALSQYNDGLLGWDKFDIRSQESWWRWDFDPNTGEVIGMWQRPAPDYSERYLPMAKSLLFRTTLKKGNPEGRSVLRSAYRPWYYKKRIEEIEGIGVERDLAGIPFATVPAEIMGLNASQEDQEVLASIVQLVQNVRRDQQEGIVWPQSWDDKGNPQYTFQLLTSGGTRQFPTDTIITRYESRMAMTVLADFILLGNDTSTGSFALSTSKTGMFQSALGTWLDSIENVLNNEAVPKLFRLNGIEGPYPKFRHDVVQQPALTDLATFISAMAGAGAQLFPDTKLENHLRETALLPVREHDEDNEELEDQIIHQQLETQLASSEAQQQVAEHTGRDANAEGLVPQNVGALPAGMGIPITENSAGAGGGGTGSPGPQNPPVATTPGGNQQGSKPGAPTRSTGPVKSKLPPTERRSTISQRARNNTMVKKKYVITKKKDAIPSDTMKEFAFFHLKNGGYDPSELNWVKNADWEASKKVPLDEIDMQRRPGGRNPHEIKMLKQVVQGGVKLPPIVLVKVPGENKYRIADGWHRTAAMRDAGKSKINALIGHVKSADGLNLKDMAKNDDSHNIELFHKRLQYAVGKRLYKDTQCRYCGNYATSLVGSSDTTSSIPACQNHIAQAEADLRWQANDEISPVNPNPYVPFPRVIEK